MLATIETVPFAILPRARGGLLAEAASFPLVCGIGDARSEPMNGETQKTFHTPNSPPTRASTAGQFTPGKKPEVPCKTS